jgi:3-isopropylmalate/(R)-2-methylmalate dehydratase small subunit
MHHRCEGTQLNPVRTIEGVAVALEAPNIDTDQIIPARFLLKSRDVGYANLLFHDHRFTAEGIHRLGFPLDCEVGEPVRILIANKNFGCGSAREQAVYALSDFGIGAVIAPSFGEIFRLNCIRNGVVPASVTCEIAAQLRALVNLRPARLKVDLQTQQIVAEGFQTRFTIEESGIERLMSGRDEIDDTMVLEAAIAAYEAKREQFLPLS